MAKEDKRPGKALMKKNTTKNKQPDPNDNIAKSKKLLEKIQKRKTRMKSNSPRSSVRSKDDSRICSKRKPMPSLSELEKMYEDSDDDNQSKSVSSQTGKPLTNSSQEVPTDKLTSPKTIKKVADKMMDLIANLPDPTIIEDDASPSPPKKHKTAECPQNFKKLCNNDVYKIDLSEHNECPKETLIDPEIVNVPNSSVNKKTDNIVEWLEDCEKGNNSDDSNETIDYDCTTLPASNFTKSQPFSPLPSTSKDKETIQKNDQLFNESLISESSMCNTQSKINTQIENGTDSDIEKKPKENVKSESVLNITESSNTCDLEIIETPYETIVIDDDSVTKKSIVRKNSNKNDIIECIDIVEPVIIKESINVADYSEPIVIEDEDGYKFINDSPIHDEIADVIDIDDIIAENKAIIKKYSNMDINTITCVDTSTISSLNTPATAESSSSSRIHNTTSNKRIENIVTEDESAKHTNNNIQNVVTNYFSNNSHSHNQDTSRNQVGTRLCNKVNEWINNLNTSSATNKRRRPRIRKQNVHPSNNSVIETYNVPSTSSNIPNRSTDAPSQIRTNRSNNCEALDLNIAKGNSEHLHVYYYGDDVHITGSDVPPPGIDTSKYIHKKLPAAFMYEKKETLEALIRLLGERDVPEPSKNFGDCPICMESLSNKSVASTICGHVFCMRCIEAAFKASGKRCPTCRKVLKKGGYHQIFV